MCKVTTVITMFRIIISGKTTFIFTFFKHTNQRCARPHTSGGAVKLEAAAVSAEG